MKKYKIIIACSCLMLMFFTIGAAAKTVVLLNDALLIDLGKAIEKAVPGTGGGQSVSGNNGNDSVASGNQTPVEGEDFNTAESVSGDGVPSSVTVSVRDTTIKIDGAVVYSPDRLKKIIPEKYPEGVSISLVDDYAKSSVFHEVIEVLKQLKETGRYDFRIV